MGCILLLLLPVQNIIEALRTCVWFSILKSEMYTYVALAWVYPSRSMCSWPSWVIFHVASKILTVKLLNDKLDMKLSSSVRVFAARGEGPISLDRDLMDGDDLREYPRTKRVENKEHLSKCPSTAGRLSAVGQLSMLHLSHQSRAYLFIVHASTDFDSSLGPIAVQTVEQSARLAYALT